LRNPFDFDLECTSENIRVLKVLIDETANEISRIRTPSLYRGGGGGGFPFPIGGGGGGAPVPKGEAPGNPMGEEVKVLRLLRPLRATRVTPAMSARTSPKRKIFERTP